MSERATARRSPRSRPTQASDWQRIDRLSDSEIAAAVRADPDAAPLLDKAWFRAAKVVLPERKVPVSLRLDREVVAWFKAQGPGYQSRINAVLKAFVAAQKGGD